MDAEGRIEVVGAWPLPIDAHRAKRFESGTDVEKVITGLRMHMGWMHDTRPYKRHGSCLWSIDWLEADGCTRPGFKTLLSRVTS